MILFISVSFIVFTIFGGICAAFLHELGHFIAARILRHPVLGFRIGRGSKARLYSFAGYPLIICFPQPFLGAGVYTSTLNGEMKFTLFEVSLLAVAGILFDAAIATAIYFLNWDNIYSLYHFKMPLSLNTIFFQFILIGMFAQSIISFLINLLYPFKHSDGAFLILSLMHKKDTIQRYLREDEEEFCALLNKCCSVR